MNASLPLTLQPLRVHLTVAAVVLGLGLLNLMLARLFRPAAAQDKRRAGVVNYPHVALLVSGWVGVICGLYTFLLLGARE